nr:unnamed protein product [Callosobruchus analis]
MNSFPIILTVFLACYVTLSGANSREPKVPAKRSIITAYPDASRFAEVFHTRDSSGNILEKFLEDEDNKAFTITKNGDYVFQIPLLEHESSEDYYDYDELENDNEDERSSNEIDNGSANKETVRKNGEAMEVPEYIVKFFIEQKMLREHREKENKCKDEEPELTPTSFEPDYDDMDFFIQSNDQSSLETADGVADYEMDEEAGEEEDLEKQVISTTEAQHSETTFQDRVTSYEATPTTTVPPKALHPRWNSLKNIFSSISNYQPHSSKGSLIQNVDRFISRSFGNIFRNKRSALGKKLNRRSFRDLLYQIVPRQYAKRYIAPKYFPKANLVASEVYPVLTKKILQNELEDLPKKTSRYQTENLSTREQFRTLEDIFKDEGRRNRRNKRPIDYVGSFEQVF